MVSEKTILQKEQHIPILDSVDVLVVGGGPAGVAAAVGAACCGMNTMLVERHGFLGGMWTAGLVLTLAGYNVGFGHLEDARILTQRHGENPDTWCDVKKYLPLLSQKKYYKTLKRGFARGKEPVDYVDNIRGYYELLIWEQENAANLRRPTTMPLTTAPLSL